jgi:beta-lactamase class A
LPLRWLLVVFVVIGSLGVAVTLFGVHLLTAPPSAVAAGLSAATPGTSVVTASGAAPTAAAPATASAVLDAARSAALTKALAAVPKGRYAEFSVAVRNNRTGASYQYRASDTYETASIVKADILAAVLLRAQDAGRSLTSNEKALARKMIRASDNNAASSLYSGIGGSRGLRAANKRFGMTATVPSSEGWGLTRTTVADQVALLGKALGSSGPLTSASRAYIRGLMTTVESDQDWGVPAAARGGETYAVKNGWDTESSNGGRWIVNSIGRITGPDTDLTIVVLSHGHSGMSVGVALVEKITKLARRNLSW